MGNARIWDKYKDDVRAQGRKLDQAKKKSLLDQVEQGGEGGQGCSWEWPWGDDEIPFLP